MTIYIPLDEFGAIKTPLEFYLILPLLRGTTKVTPSLSFFAVVVRLFSLQLPPKSVTLTVTTTNCGIKKSAIK